MLNGLSPTRRRFVLLLGVVALVVLLVVVAVAVVRARSGPDPVAQDRRGPVLLVSGYGGSTAALQPLATDLRSRGRDVVVVPAVGGGTGDLAKQAEALDRAADRAMSRYDADSVDVVGYSAGGVVARSWVRDHGGAGKARRVVSIGSPQHGTDVAALASGSTGCSVACRQLDPDSSFLRALNAGDETPAGPLFVSIWSTSDQTSTPPATARLDGAAVNLTVQSICPARRTSHGALPADPVVRALLVSSLGRSRPEPPPRSTNCGIA